MSRQSKLNDLQLILLSHAAARDTRNVMPLPETVTDAPRAEKNLKALLRRGLVTEAETTTGSHAWRSDGDLHFALLIADAALAALGLDEGTGEGSGEPAANDVADAAPKDPPKPRSDSKIASVIALLKRGEGATLAELVEATGWQPHTTRAALTGLRKKGHTVAKAKGGDVTCYRIGETA